MQCLASICAGFLADAMLPVDIVKVNTTLAPGVSITQGLFIEMFLTAELVLVILMLAVEKSKTSFMAPVGIGLALLVAEFAGVYFTGGSLNPARSLGCAVAARQFPGYHWIYWLGPLMGGVLASAYHRVIKMLHYEKANPGQDSANGGFMQMDGV
jgi:aquaporin rerated protein, other eukaryote